MAKTEKVNLEIPNLLAVYSKKVDKAFKAAVRDALLKHKKAGHQVAVSRRGKAVLLAPDEILPGEK